MNNVKNYFTMKAILVAVQGVLIVLAMVPNTYAAESVYSDSAVTELTKPTSKIELGVGHVSEGSFKAGEYNGLQDQGAYGIANIDLRGGDSYDSDGVMQYRIKGNNLGLENRGVSAEVGQQGKFRINFGYDELLRNRSDSYQTPYQGEGSNSLTLPSTWIKPVITSGGALNLRGLDANPAVGLAATRTADMPAFHSVDLYTKREKYDGGFSYLFDPQWEFKASMSHEKKTGLKPMSTVSSQVAEFSAVIADKIDQDTDQYNASLNFTGTQSFLQAAYYGSIFRNHVDSMTWQDINDLTKSATMSSAPSNQFHQFGLTGGYNFTPTTKLVMKGSYARNTQDDAFLGASTAANGQLPAGLPKSSLDGLIVTKAFDMKLTAKPTNGLNLSGAYKYDDRDNRTPVNTYAFHDANESASATSLFTYTNPATGIVTSKSILGSNINLYSNRAYSKKVNQINLDADYNLKGSQWVKTGVDWQKVETTCPGSWISCADASATKETTGRIGWRGNVAEDISGKVGYSYSHRTVNYNENAFLAFVPMANQTPTGASMSAYQYMLNNGLLGFGPLAGYINTGLDTSTAGVDRNIFFPSNNKLANAAYASRNNVNELLGLRRFNMSGRDSNKLRTSVNWQANDKLSLQGGLNYSNDNYDATYGLKDGKSWSLNLDGTYTVSEDLSASVFFNHEDQKANMASDAYGSNSNTTGSSSTPGTIVGSPTYNNILAKNNNAKLDPALQWSTDMHDRVDTLGFSLQRKNLLADKLNLGGDLVFSRARTMVNVNGGSYVTGVGQNSATGTVYFIPAGNMPTVKNDTIELRFNGKYKINKSSSVQAAYSFLHMNTTDYAYDGMQLGTVTIVMPTLEKAPSYNVHSVGASYIYSF
jgi:MtrB/PioB family decaheme-associated outer membrane protein